MVLSTGYEHGCLSPVGHRKYLNPDPKEQHDGAKLTDAITPVAHGEGVWQVGQIISGRQTCVSVFHYMSLTCIVMDCACLSQE